MSASVGYNAPNQPLLLFTSSRTDRIFEKHSTSFTCSYQQNIRSYPANLLTSQPPLNPGPQFPSSFTTKYTTHQVQSHSDSPPLHSTHPPYPRSDHNQHPHPHTHAKHHHHPLHNPTPLHNRLAHPLPRRGPHALPPHRPRRKRPHTTRLLPGCV
jgi:hypothetical protein